MVFPEKCQSAFAPNPDVSGMFVDRLNVYYIQSYLGRKCLECAAVEDSNRAAHIAKPYPASGIG